MAKAMGISRDSRYKRRLTGGHRKIHQKKRKFELGRPAAMTKIGAKRVREVRCRGGNMKYRALKLDNGNFAWGGQRVTRKTRVLDTVYNATNNEYVRTKTLTKNTIVQIDATPFKQWYAQFYGETLGKKKADEEEVKKSKSVLRKLENRRQAAGELEPKLKQQFDSGRLLACIASRPGQSGRCDGYILEGAELEFYTRKLDKKKRH